MNNHTYPLARGERRCHCQARYRLFDVAVAGVLLTAVSMWMVIFAVLLTALF